MNQGSKNKTKLKVVKLDDKRPLGDEEQITLVRDKMLDLFSSKIFLSYRKKLFPDIVFLNPKRSKLETHHHVVSIFQFS